MIISRKFLFTQIDSPFSLPLMGPSPFLRFFRNIQSTGILTSRPYHQIHNWLALYPELENT